MSIWGESKSAAKFVFVKIPAGILGVNTLRSNHQTIKALYETISNPAPQSEIAANAVSSAGR